MWKKFCNLIQYRKLQFDILTIFLLLLLFYSALIIWSTYRQNKQTVLDFSSNLMKEVTSRVIEHVDTLTTQMEALAAVDDHLIDSLADISPSNKELLAFMMNSMRVNPSLTILHVAGINGTWLGVYQINAKIQSIKKFPKGTRFAIQYDDRTTTPHKEVWIYIDEEGNTIGADETRDLTFDPRVRPWFIGALETNKTFWTSVYIFALTKVPGITVGIPIHYDAEKRVIGVSAGDIETRSLSVFLGNLKISPHGTSYIIAAGNAIAGPNILTQEQNPFAVPKLTPIGEVNPIVAAGYQEYLKNGKNFFVFNKNGVNYLASFTPLNLNPKEPWTIALVAPESDFLSKVLKAQERLYFISLILLLLASILITFFAKKISNPIVLLATEVDKIRRMQLDEKIEVHSGIKEVHMMKVAISAMKSTLKSFSRFMPKEIISQLLEQGKEIELGGEKKNVTIFFSDIYNFTTISESLPTEKVLPQLTVYLEELSEIILKSKGTIDKYLGDGIMAFWGAPTELEDHAFQGCRAALLCQYKLNLLNADWEKRGMPVFITRIGLHSSPAIVGIIGTAKRMNYTVMGDPVNLAARLEAINKNYQTRIVISEDVYAQVKKRFLVRPLDIVAVKGKKIKVKIYELVGEFEGPGELVPTKEQIEFCALFEKGYNLFHAQGWEEAKSIFTELLHKYPDDYPSKLYLERIGESKPSV